MIAPFEASKVKLQRARGHLTNLEAETAAYLAGNPCAIVVEPFEGVPGCQSWNARIREPVPLSLAGTIGDVVHNLRTALDVLACDLVRVNAKNPKSVYFPFCDTASDLRATIKKRNLHKAGADIETAIQSLRPYKGGNIALRAIHDMDIADKHQALLPVLSAVSVPLRDVLKHPCVSIPNWASLIVKDGQMVIGTPKFPHITLGMEIPANFFLAFGEGPGWGSRPVIECLYELAQTADSVFETLTALRPGATFPSIGA